MHLQSGIRIYSYSQSGQITSPGYWDKQISGFELQVVVVVYNFILDKLFNQRISQNKM